MVQVIEHLQGCYMSQEVPFGVVYKWSPECVVVECECRARTTLTVSMAICSGCGADHADIIREALAAVSLKEESIRPWRYAGEREGLGLPC